MATVNIEISEQREADMLCGAIEGGSNYWYQIGEDGLEIIDQVAPSDGDTPFVDRMFKAIQAGKSIPVYELPDGTGFDIDVDSETKKLGEISLESISRGEQIMANEYPNDFMDIVSENDDASTADVWFQLAVMGKLVYG